MASLNAHLASDNPTGTFVTLVYAILEPETGRLTYANAGHNPPALVRRDGPVETLVTTGLPVGLLPGATYRTEEGALGPDDALVVYSDGVTEAFGPGEALYGDERLFGLLGSLGNAPPKPS